MMLLHTCLLVLVAYPLVVFAKRRRVPFLNCPSAKSNSGLVTVKPARSRIECSVMCLNDPDCLSASYCKTSDGYKCQLSGSYVEGSCTGLVPDGDCTQTAVVNPCENGGTFFPGNRTCQCVPGFTGDYCHRRYRDCQESPLDAKIHTLQPSLNSDYTFEWYCGPGLHVTTQIMTFIGASTANFSRTLQAMTQGIPVQPHFFFLGLENIYQLTKHGSYDLYVTMLVFSGGKHGLVVYKNVRVDSETEGYSCHWDNVEISYSTFFSDEYLDGLGGAGDVTKNLNGARFATYDQNINGCASSKGSGWWFNPIGCTLLRFRPGGLLWRTGTLETMELDTAYIDLVRVYWYVEDDLVL